MPPRRRRLDNAVAALAPPTLGEFEKLVIKLSPAAVILAVHEPSECGKLQQIGKCYMEDQAKALCERADSKPTMLVYGSDLTPMVMSSRNRIESEERTVIRQGGRCAEWNVHRMFTMAFDNMGELESRAVFEGPVDMASKRSWHIFASYERLCPWLPEWHPLGPSLSWYSFDRGCSGPMGRLIHMRHQQQISFLPEAERYIRSLLDLQFFTNCADHTVQSGLLHGCEKGVESPSAVYKNVFKAIRSLRDTLDKIVLSFPAWAVGSHL